MLLILEIGMFIGGLYAIIAAKVPSILVGGGKYRVEGMTARLLGVLLILPLPLAFLGGLLLGVLFGEEGLGYATFCELGAVFGVAILAVVAVRVAGKKVEPESSIEGEIAKKAQGALMFALLSATGVAALICCPLAFVYARQATAMIEQHGVGEQYRKTARSAQVIAVVVTALWIAAVACLGVLLMTGQ